MHDRSLESVKPGSVVSDPQTPQPAGPGRVTLVLGGVRSGKSRYAEQLAQRAERVTFVATARRGGDEEMERKIDRHREERPTRWLTIEEPLDLPHVIRTAGRACDVLVIDCLTLFAANLLDAYGDQPQQLEAALSALCVALKTAPCGVVLVSNEVGSGVVPAYASGRQFRDVVGEINQQVAAVADPVVLMVAGLPLALKGLVYAGGER